jgi:hypothetical protein
MDADYLPIERVAQLLAVSTRHAHRACQKAGVRASKAGKRTLYHRLDVERLAVELGADYRHIAPAPGATVPTETAATSSAEPSTALVPYDALQRQLDAMQRELADVKGMLAQLVEQHATPAVPAVDSTPRRLSWWRHLFRG